MRQGVFDYKRVILQMIIGLLLGRVWVFSMNPFAVAFFGVTCLEKKGKMLIMASVLAGMATAMPGTALMKYVLLFSILLFVEYLLEKGSEKVTTPLRIAILLGGVNLVLCITMGALAYDTGRIILLGVLESMAIVALLNIFQWGMRVILYESIHKVLTNEELISLMAMTTLALYGIPTYLDGFFSIVQMIAYFLLLFIGYRYGSSAGGIAGAAGGILAAMKGDGLEVIGLYCLLGIAVGLFRQAGKILTSIAFVTMGLVLAYVFQEDIMGIVELRGIVSAVIIFIAIPKHAMKMIDIDGMDTEEDPFDKQDIRTIANYKMDDFSVAFRKLSHSFEKFAYKENKISGQEMELMFEELSQKVCSSCTNCHYCWDKHYEETAAGMQGILQYASRHGRITEEQVGIEFTSRCIRLEECLDKANESISVAKMNLGFRNKLSESREAMSRQMMEVAKMLADFSVELDQVKETSKEEKKRLLQALRREGLLIRKLSILRKRGDRMEVHFQTKKKGNGCVTRRDVAAILYQELGVHFRGAAETRNVITDEYEDMVFEEDTNFKALTGMARVKKSGEKVSGDNFSFLELTNGELLMILSDGMGSGQLANEDSEALVEVLENLMEAGFRKDSAIRLLNSMFTLSYEGRTFTTLDMTSINLYTGECQLMKNGAAATFIKRADRIETILSGTLPVGIDMKSEPEQQSIYLEDGDFVVMVTDGIVDAFPGEEKEFYIENILENCDSNNPSEMVNTILMQALDRCGGEATDDMSVLAAGIWKKE